MNIKNNLLIACLLFVGTAFAQETPPPPMEETVAPTTPVRSTERFVSPPPPPPPPEERSLSPNEVVEFPEVDAQFPGGMEAMQKFIQDNVKYPEVDRQLGTEGRVYMTFVVERDGSISGIDVMRRGVSATLNREATRLIETMPLWIPAEDRGVKVRARCRLPISFTLSSGEDD